MGFLKKWWNYFVDFFVGTVIGKTTWLKLYAKFHKGKEYLVTDFERIQIRDILKSNYCLIMTRRNTHLSTYVGGWAHWLLMLLHGKKPKIGYWSHCLMNVENEVQSLTDFRLVEAIGTGIGFSSFDSVFNCDSVALMIIEGVACSSDWNDALEYDLTQLGKPYDTLLDFNNPDRQTCIELIHNALDYVPKAVKVRDGLDAMLKEYGALTPQMLYDCPGLKVIFEVRH